MALTGRLEDLIGIIQVFQCQYSSSSLVEERTFDLTTIFQDVTRYQSVDTFRVHNRSIDPTTNNVQVTGGDRW